ncbi:MAG TPA: hypothetical protein VJ992_13710 [Gemmatimonadales bacterium]|nr:hypothetical protein [Gemmatimonadales bacterium]
MSTQRTDFLVGLFILVTVGVIAGALVVTSGIGEARHEFYMRAASAEDLTTDTRVELLGLAVGRVSQVNPVVDSATGAVSFVARLTIQDKFPNGTKLSLPAGTRGVIRQASPIAPSVIVLDFPDRPVPGAYLAAGDTMSSNRPESAIASLGKIAAALGGEADSALRDTRALARRTMAAIAQAQGLLSHNGPQLHEALARLTETLDRTEAVLAAVEPRIVPLDDSLTATLADTRALLRHMDTLVTTASAITTANRDVIRETAERLRRSSEVLEHFADQVSRRPTRLLTGVTPPPDTNRKVP